MAPRFYFWLREVFWTLALPPGNVDELPVAHGKDLPKRASLAWKVSGSNTFHHVLRPSSTVKTGEIDRKSAPRKLIVTLKKVTGNTSNGPKAGTHTCVYELWMGTFTYPEADAFA